MMNKLLAILFPFCLTANVAISHHLQVLNLSCKGLEHPLGVDDRQPALSWQLQAAAPNTVQMAWQVLVATDSNLLLAGKGNCWNSGKVISSASIGIKYKGNMLLSGVKYFWKVRVWDNHGHVSAFSKISSWQMGLLALSHWQNAQWIGYAQIPDKEIIVPALHGNGPKAWGTRLNVLPLLRKQFDVANTVKRATAFVCGLGHFELSINGKKVGTHFLDPGWTNYSQHAQYVTFDVTAHVRQGVNAVGIMLGNGFYYIPSLRYRKMTGAYGYPKAIMCLRLEYSNGKIDYVVTNKSWRTAPSPIIFSSIYGGEDYDATKEQIGWNTPHFNDSGWQPTVEVTGHKLVAQMATPLKIVQTFEPVSVTTNREGQSIYHFAQNMSGIPCIKVQGQRGDTIRMIPAELLLPDGQLNQKPMGSPAYYQYVLSGRGIESWQPRFTYHGFKHIQVQVLQHTDNAGKPLPKLMELTALHVRNSADSVGSFYCSSELLNKTNKLIKWAINSNMQSLFTDCPHRERLGWQEQLHLMGNAVQFNYNIHALGIKIAADIRASQYQNGLIPSTVPEFTQMHFANGYFRDSPEWGSSGVLFPWLLFNAYADTALLRQQYASMQRYMEYLRSKDSSCLLMYGLGDWYDLGPDRPGFSQLTPMGLTATAYYYHSLITMQAISKILGRLQQANYYAQWAAQVKHAFHNHFYNPATGNYGSGSQTSNAIALNFNLVPAYLKARVLNNLLQDIEQRNFTFTSGDIGFFHLLSVLQREGYTDVIYRMNHRTDVPGYGYQIAKGATALTESWLASEQVSNNHFMLGHIMDWFYTGLAGIQQTDHSAGYKHLLLCPQVPDSMDYAGAQFNGPYGKVVSTWKRVNKAILFNFEIPANSTATYRLKGNASSRIFVNGQMQSGVNQKGIFTGHLGSGKYEIRIEN
ncbi:MAG TPA: family 78 glycoside hydrolase catalytic domain [Phnomibacter sp.]|nr:family 78 glycoside hydrolase catalytic domain [Phnomibacter sp.]